MTGELAGSLRERVTIQRRGAGRDALGGAAGEWETIGAGWAAIGFDRAGAAVAAEAIEAAAWWRIVMRARDDIAPDDRLLWDGRVLRVRSVERDPRAPDRLRIRAEEAR